MSRTRIYQNIALEPQTLVRLNEKASHHLARVLRAKTGENIIVFNGQGGEYQTIIRAIDKKGVEVEITQFQACEVESPLRIILAQGIARGEKMDFIIQKAVELGVSQIYPLITERCNVHLKDERETKRIQHWQSVIISACEQSGRDRIPQIFAPLKLSDWILGHQADLNFVLSPHVQDPLPSEKPGCSSIGLLLGPEGGLSDLEVSLAQERGFKPLKIGPRVLRTETATITALSAIQLLYGDLH